MRAKKLLQSSFIAIVLCSMCGTAMAMSKVTLVYENQAYDCQYNGHSFQCIAHDQIEVTLVDKLGDAYQCFYHNGQFDRCAAVDDNPQPVYVELTSTDGRAYRCEFNDKKYENCQQIQRLSKKRQKVDITDDTGNWYSCDFNDGTYKKCAPKKQATKSLNTSDGARYTCAIISNVYKQCSQDIASPAREIRVSDHSGNLYSCTTRFGLLDTCTVIMQQSPSPTGFAVTGRTQESAFSQTQTDKPLAFPDDKSVNNQTNTAVVSTPSAPITKEAVAPAVQKQSLPIENKVYVIIGEDDDDGYFTCQYIANELEGCIASRPDELKKYPTYLSYLSDDPKTVTGDSILYHTEQTIEQPEPIEQTKESSLDAAHLRETSQIAPFATVAPPKQIDNITTNGVQNDKASDHHKTNSKRDTGLRILAEISLGLLFAEIAASTSMAFYEFSNETHANKVTRGFEYGENYAYGVGLSHALMWASAGGGVHLGGHLTHTMASTWTPYVGAALGTLAGYGMSYAMEAIHKSNEMRLVSIFAVSPILSVLGSIIAIQISDTIHYNKTKESNKTASVQFVPAITLTHDHKSVGLQVIF